MKLKKWGVPAAIIVIGCAGLIVAVDQLFKLAVSVSESAGGERVVLMAEGGFLTGRRATYLLCGAWGSARVVTKTRLYARDYLQPGAKTTEGGIHISPWEQRVRAPVAVKMPVTLTSKDWVDTLESDVMPQETATPIVKGLRNPANDFIGVHAFEHGFYFRRNTASVDLRALDRCVSG